MSDSAPEFRLVVSEEMIMAAARAIHGNRISPWTTMERLTCEGQALRALRAAWEVAGGWN